MLTTHTPYSVKLVASQKPLSPWGCVDVVVVVVVGAAAVAAGGVVDGRFCKLRDVAFFPFQLNSNYVMNSNRVLT